MRKLIVLCFFLPLCLNLNRFFPSIDSDRYLKFGCIFLIFVYIFRGRLKKPGPIPVLIVATYSVLFFVSLVFDSHRIRLDFEYQFAGLIGYSYYWLLMFINFEDLNQENFVIRVIRFLPSISVIIGILIERENINRVFRFDLGTARLQGALTPAVLALLCVSAAVASLVWQRKNGMSDWMLTLNFLICILTGTRISSLLFLGIISFSILMEIRNGLTKYSIILFVGFSMAALVGSASLVSRLKNSNINSNSGSSGRATAWKFYSSFLRENLYFGNGFGFSSQVNRQLAPSNVSSAFESPHNSFLQLLLDIGIVGSITLLLIFIFFWRSQSKLVVSSYQGSLNSFYIFMPFAFGFDNYVNSPHFNIPVFLILSLLLKK